ncbi:MAG TPA: hypothetical protein VGZ71_12035 [Puia sp.]|nr:hypothetical protein [Puia sp.]
METNSTQQEILLRTGTSFSQRHLSDKCDSGSPKHLTEMELLEEACWNGLLKEMLPEICEESGKGKNLYLWEVRESASCLHLEIGQYPQPKEGFFSIDPTTFLGLKSLN